MLNEIAEFKAYMETLIYKRDGKKMTTHFSADSLVRVYKALKDFLGHQP